MWVISHQRTIFPTLSAYILYTSAIYDRQEVFSLRVKEKMCFHILPQYFIEYLLDWILRLDDTISAIITNVNSGDSVIFFI